LENVRRRFGRDLGSRITLVRADASLLTEPSSTLSEDVRSAAAILENERIACVLFDMDLYDPTRQALEWISKWLTQGCFLIFDEYFSFAGSMNLGEARAVREWLQEHPEFKLRDFGSYGSGGKIFVLDLVLTAESAS
jgi:hypothetical protein